MGLTKTQSGGLEDQSVTLDKLPHGTSSNDGKFLRANNGADPTFESLPSGGATLSGSTNNTVVTVTGANAMQGEANLTFDGSTLAVTGGMNATKSADSTTTSVITNNGTSGGNVLKLTSGGTGAGTKIFSVFKNNQVSETGVFAIDGSGKVGIGTSSPTLSSSAYQGLHIHQTASGGAKGSQIHLTNDYGGSAAGDGSHISHYNNYLYINNQENGSTYFYNNGSPTATILANGNFGVATQAPLKKLDVNGDIKASSIYFGGTSTANQLDDYETGTWTPTQGNFNTFSLSSGQFNATYTKIGNIVHFSFQQTGGTLDWSQAQYIGGLPFTVNKNGVGSWSNNYPNSGGEMIIWGTNVLYFAQTDGYNTSSYKLVFSGTYETNQ